MRVSDSHKRDIHDLTARASGTRNLASCVVGGYWVLNSTVLVGSADRGRDCTVSDAKSQVSMTVESHMLAATILLACPWRQISKDQLSQDLKEAQHNDTKSYVY